jgi:hypothetical protein
MRGTAKKRKTGPEPSTEAGQRRPIEGLEEYKRIQRLWPEDMGDIFTAEEAMMPQVCCPLLTQLFVGNQELGIGPGRLKLCCVQAGTEAAAVGADGPRCRGDV